MADPTILNIDCHLTSRRVQRNLRSSIFRIPSMLKMQNQLVHTPHAFSFGPWHYHKQELMMATKQFKEMLFEGLIQRLVERQRVNVEVDISANKQELEGAIPVIIERLQNARSDKKMELEKAIEAVGSKARECYEGDTNVKQEEFHKILLLDGCFIIELFRKGADEVSIQESERPLFFSTGMILTIYHDLFLLENQIPWFVLELLFDKTRGPESKTLVELAITFIRSAFSLDDDQQPISKELLASGSSIVHIIDLTGRFLGSSAKERKKPKQSQCRINWGCCLCYSAKERKEQQPKHSKSRINWGCYLSSSAQERKEQQPKQSQSRITWGCYLGSFAEDGKKNESQSLINPIPCATRLREAGVKFVRVLKERNLLDVRFNKGALEIPTLVIHPATETIFRNLIMFQQCNPWDWSSWAASSVIISYAMLLDFLVDSTEDVDLLRNSGIFSSWLNQKETVDMLNRLCSGSYMDEFYYADLCEDVNRYCKRCCTKWRVFLFDSYVTKPWAIVPVIVATIVLVFTIMQVFYK